MAARKVDPSEVIARYTELRHLEQTGRDFGITRERVRQIVNAAGISTARPIKPTPVRRCRECGAGITEPRVLYCEAHRPETYKRYRRAVKADPERDARRRERQKRSDRERARRRGAQEGG